VGYSTIMFGSAVKETAAGSAARYYCLEYNPVFAAIIMALVDLAGLSDIVKVVIGPSTSSISRLAAEGVLKDGVDFMFLDHLKPLYTPDLKLCESLGLIKVGTVLAADNMVKPGNPPYHKYVNMSPSEKAAEAEGKRGAERGDPTLRYENEWVESWEPQAVRVSLLFSQKWKLVLMVGRMHWRFRSAWSRFLSDQLQKGTLRLASGFRWNLAMLTHHPLEIDVPGAWGICQVKRLA